MSEENTATPVVTALDDFEEINGISNKGAQILHDAGIVTFYDLAQQTPERLSSLLQAGGLHISPKTIRTQKWVAQASARAKTPDNRPNNPQGDGTVAIVKDKPLTWEPHASFELRIDTAVDTTGNRCWHTYVKHKESQDDDILPGIDADDWLGWIEPRAKLPYMLDTTVISIKDIKVAEAERLTAEEEKQLAIKIEFQIEGAQAKKLVAECNPYYILIYTINQKNNTINFVKSVLKYLEPDRLDYREAQNLPIPDLGEYEIQAGILLLPPAELASWHKGTFIKVEP